MLRNLYAALAAALLVYPLPAVAVGISVLIGVRESADCQNEMGGASLEICVQTGSPVTHYYCPDADAPCDAGEWDELGSSLTIPGSAGELLSSDGNGGVVAGDCTISGNAIVCPANDTTGQCGSLKEAGDAAGSDSTSFCAPYNIDNADTDFLPDDIWGKGSTSYVKCFWDADASGLDDGSGGTECPGGIRFDCPTATDDAEDCKLEFFVMVDGSPFVYQTFDGSVQTGNGRYRLPGSCTQNFAIEFPLTVDGADHYVSLSGTDGSGVPIQSATEGDVDTFFMSQKFTAYSLAVFTTGVPGASFPCTVMVRENAGDTAATVTLTTSPFGTWTGEETLNTLAKMDLEYNCTSGGSATAARVGLCVGP